jgi:toxin YoeB
MKDVLFRGDAFEQYSGWAIENPKKHQKISELIKDISRHPFSGLGKPEPLKHEFKGFWSRRIDNKHRLVYSVSDDVITILSCQSHYEE